MALPLRGVTRLGSAPAAALDAVVFTASIDFSAARPLCRAHDGLPMPIGSEKGTRSRQGMPRLPPQL